MIGDWKIIWWSKYDKMSETRQKISKNFVFIDIDIISLHPINRLIDFFFISKN